MFLLEQTLSELLEQDLSSIYRWIQQVQAEQKLAPEGLNWLGLAEVATTLASVERRQAGHQDLWWAHVALAAYQVIMGAGQDDSIEVSMMCLRALFIRQYRSIPGDHLLDVDQIVRWFWARLPCTLAEVQEKVNQLRTLRSYELLELRQIKNRLAVLVPLVRDEKLHPNEELQRWLALRDQLP